MATAGTPYEGLDQIITRAYISGADLTLIAYTNAADSLSATTTVLADLTQPTSANGYAPKTLAKTGWTATNGVAAYTESASPVSGTTHPGWSATGTWSAAVTGAAIHDGTKLWHFKDLTSSFTAAAGKKLAIDIKNLAS